MNDGTQHGLSKLIRYLLLRGHGWTPRRLSSTRGREWRDPLSGHWYSERKAMALLQDQALALYDRDGQVRRPFRLNC